MFSIIIPTFNNLKYLQLCLESYKILNTIMKFIHINEGIDGTLEFLKPKIIKLLTGKNSGVCKAFNEAVKKSSMKYLVLAHDDMYFCPNWDEVFENE